MCRMCGRLSLADEGGARVLLGAGSFDRVLVPETRGGIAGYVPADEDFFGEPVPEGGGFEENLAFLQGLAARYPGPCDDPLVHYVAWAVGSALGTSWTLEIAPLSTSEIGSTYDDYRRALACVRAHPETFGPPPARLLEGD